jgi:hypothetical protein
VALPPAHGAAITPSSRRRLKTNELVAGAGCNGAQLLRVPSIAGAQGVRIGAFFSVKLADTRPGGAQPNWKVRGAALRLIDGRLTGSTNDTTMWPNVSDWPANFSLEWEL